MNTIQTILEAEKEAEKILANARAEQEKHLNEVRQEKQEVLRKREHELLIQEDQELKKLSDKLEENEKEKMEQHKKEQVLDDEVAEKNHKKAVSFLLDKILRRY